MGRFTKLDFDDQGAAPIEPHDVWPNEDEHASLRQGDENFGQGLYDPALNAYSRALRFNRDLLAAWVGQIRCLIEMSEFPEAVTWSNRALEKFPNAPDLLACKGLALVCMDEKQEGMEYLDGAIELRSPSAWVWLARGEGLLLTDQPESNAHRCFLKVLELAPDDAQFRLRIGMAYNRASQWMKARDYLLAAYKAEPNNALILYEVGIVNEGLGQYEVAAGLYQRALIQRRKFPDAEAALLRVKSTNGLKRWWRKMMANR